MTLLRSPNGAIFEPILGGIEDLCDFELPRFKDFEQLGSYIDNCSFNYYLTKTKGIKNCTNICYNCISM
jgi:hypothetical protein